MSSGHIFGKGKKLPASPVKTSPLIEARNQLEYAEGLRQKGKLVAAQKSCEALLRLYPDYVGALHTLGIILADRGKLHQAQDAFTQALNLNPRDWVVLTALSTVYLQNGANEMAARTLKQALKHKPDDERVLATLGEIYKDEREYERSAQSFRRVVDMDPEFSEAWLGLGRALGHMGELSESAKCFEEVIRIEKQSLSALYGLSQLPASLVKVDLLALLASVDCSAGTNKEDLDVTRAFANGATLAKAGRYKQAWETLKAVNRKRFKLYQGQYREDMTRRHNFLARAEKSPVLPEVPKIIDNLPVSLFIFGPSRSGKTTMERLVGKIKGVKRGYENPILRNTARRTFQVAGLPTGDNIIELPPGLNDLCHQHYLEELEERAGSARVFTNTHPGRIFDTYRMAVMLPNVRFVFMQRDVNDLILRMFQKLYNSGNYYSYDIGAAREYIQWYHDLQNTLARLLPDHTTIIQYENMIADPRSALGAAARLCELEMSYDELPEIGDDRGCAQPYKKFF